MRGTTPAGTEARASLRGTRSAGSSPGSLPTPLRDGRAPREANLPEVRVPYSVARDRIALDSGGRNPRSGDAGLFPRAPSSESNVPALGPEWTTP